MFKDNINNELINDFKDLDRYNTKTGIFNNAKFSLNCLKLQ